MENGQFHPVIFDMDGVIFDSERLLMESWKLVADKYGIEGIEDTLRQCFGVNVEVSRQIYFDRYGPDFPLDLYKQETRAHFRSQCTNGHPPVKAGVRELLDYLNGRGVPLALASSTSTEIVRAELEGAGLLDCFSVVIGGDQIERSKPAPDIFLAAAEALGAKAEDCFVIEDSFNGVRAGKAAGMHTLMVPDMVPPDREMKEKAEAILPSLNEVRNFLASRL